MSTLTKIYELAEIVKRAAEAEDAAQVALLSSEHEVAFLEAARETAVTVLGNDAASLLTWRYDHYVDGNASQATAELSPNVWLQHGYNHDTEESWFRLVRHCDTCSQQRFDDVAGLADLASLLAESVFAAESALTAQDGGAQ